MPAALYAGSGVQSCLARASGENSPSESEEEGESVTGRVVTNGSLMMSMPMVRDIGSASMRGVCVVRLDIEMVFKSLR